MKNPIREAIKCLGSQQELAKVCGVSQNAISKWVNGSRVSLENALKIEQATDSKVKAEDINPSFAKLLSRY